MEVRKKEDESPIIVNLAGVLRLPFWKDLSTKHEHDFDNSGVCSKCGSHRDPWTLG